MAFEVGIVGAGIAGLAATIGLRRAGAKVEVFERSQFKNEIGAAISLTPNATRVLDYWGFDFDKAGTVQSQQIRMTDPHKLNVFFQDSFAHAAEKYGHAFEHYHRADLHNAMRDLAQEPKGEGKPAKINLGKKVVDVDCEKGTIILEDGSSFTKDLIVVADGISSNLNVKIAEQADPLEKTGWSMYRGLVPMSQIRSSSKYPILASIFGPEVPPGFWVPVDLPTAFFFVTYPCRNNEVLNLALRHSTLPHEADSEDWHADARLEDALKVVEGYHPVMEEILRMVEPKELKVYNLMRRDPFEQVVRGRAVAVGDSAETVQPTHAQGAVLAIEQAGALEVFFRDLISNSSSQQSIHSQITERLLLYQSLLLPRIHLNQHLCDTQPMAQDDHRRKAEKICEEQQQLAEKYLKNTGGKGCSGTATGGKPLFPVTAAFYGPEIQEFFWSYDVLGEAKAVLEREKVK